MATRSDRRNWALCDSLAELAVSCRPRTRCLMLLHCASAPGAPEAPPALVQIDERGVVTLIKRVREARHGRLGR